MPLTIPVRYLLPFTALALAACPDTIDDTALPPGDAVCDAADGALAITDASPRLADGPTNGPSVDSGAAPDAASTDSDAADDVERVISLVLAAPDLPPQYVCLGSFATDESGQPVGEPLLAGGPFGIPDREDPTGKALRSGFPYGTVVKLPLFRHDRVYFDGLAPIGFLVDDVDVHETVRGGDSQPCKRAWASARGDLGRQIALSPVVVGASFLSAVTGCRAPSAAPECGGGNNLATTLERLDTSSGIESDTGAGLAIQVANLSAAISLQNLDVYLQPMRASDGGSSAQGEPLALSSVGLARGQLTVSARVDLDGFDPALTRLLLVPHGAAPCTGGDECTTLAVPIEPFRTRYAAPTGGATGAAWDGHQVLALLGSGDVDPDGGAPSTRLAMFRATFATSSR